jgi:hypothetical protein
MNARPAPASIARPSLQPWLWTGFLALVMALPVLRSALPAPVPPPPVLGTVPDFRLIDQTERRSGPSGWRAGCGSPTSSSLVVLTCARG